MPVRVQSLRSSTKGQRPGANTREPGEIYVNFADLQLGVVNATKNPQDLVAIRYFSTAADYPAGSYVVQAGVLYKSKGAITAGAFNASNWDAIPLPGGYEPPISAGTTSDYWRGDKTWQALNKAAVGLSNVDNTADSAKPVSTLQQAAIDARVLDTGDTMTGHLGLPTGPSAQHAVRKDYVDGLISPINASIAGKADIASPTFTGDPKAPTPSAADNDTSIATTAFVKTAVTTATTGLIGEAPNTGIQYVRQSLAWAPVSVPPGTAVSDTPPPTPSSGQLWFESDTGKLFIWYTDANSSQWVQMNGPSLGGGTAEARNRIVNGAMQISQENGNTAFGPLDGLAGYPADQFVTLVTASPSTATMQRVQSVTPNGSKDRMRITVNTAKAVLAAADVAQWYTAIEGSKVADFQYGTASAKQSILRFGWKSPAGTYAVSVGNNLGDRSYVAIFTVSAGQANTNTTQTFVIPGDTTGTWEKGTSGGLWITFMFAGGSNVQGVIGWQAGAKNNTAACTNGMVTAGAVYELFDVGLYLDTYNTGIAPVWQMPDEAQELAACQRYYYKIMSTDGFSLWPNAGASLSRSGGRMHPVAVRSTPAMSVTGILNYAGGQLSPDGVSSGQFSWDCYYNTGNTSAVIVIQYITANARM